MSKKDKNKKRQPLNLSPEDNVSARFLGGPIHMSTQNIETPPPNRCAIEVETGSSLALPEGSRPTTRHLYQLTLIPTYVYLGPADQIEEAEEKFRVAQRDQKLTESVASTLNKGGK